MTWSPYELDRLALQIVLEAKERDPKPKDGDRTEANSNNRSQSSLSQSYKMRAACAYGLERFWGEHLRLAHAVDPKRKDQVGNQDKDKIREDRNKAKMIIDTWLVLVGIMKGTGIHLPKTVVDLSQQKPQALNKDAIEEFSSQIWNLGTDKAQITLSVLTSLCDSIVWWTQRLKPESGEKAADS
jgi:hypothetical protein